MDARKPSFSAIALVSILIHGIALGVWLWHEATVPTIARKTDSMSISVGLQAAMAGATVAPTLATAPPEISPQETVEPKASEALPTAEKKPEPKPKPKKQPRKPRPQEAEKKPAPPATAAALATTGAHGKEGSQVSAVKQQETGIGNRSGGAAKEAQFDYRVRQHLLSKKIPPKGLRMRKKEGTVVVQFTLDRQGNVLSSKLSSPSHIRPFDRATIKMLRQAEPFPPAPQSATWTTRTFNISVHYTVR